jgi:hypothetical protein
MCYINDGPRRHKTKGRRVIHNINKYCIDLPTMVIGYTAMIAALYVSIIMYHRNGINSSDSSDSD